MSDRSDAFTVQVAKIAAKADEAGCLHLLAEAIANAGDKAFKTKGVKLTQKEHGPLFKNLKKEFGE